MNTTIDTVLATKTLEELTSTQSVSEEEKVNFSQAKVEECIKYLRLQNGCTGETEGNEQYIGKGDKQIAKAVGLSLAQVQEVRDAMTAKIAELSPKEEQTLPVAEL